MNKSDKDSYQGFIDDQLSKIRSQVENKSEKEGKKNEIEQNQSKGKEVKFDLNTYMNMGLSRVEAESFIACLKTQEFLSNKMLSTNKPTENGGHQ